MAEWQPIETAPKSRVIDLWIDDRRIPDCRWCIPNPKPQKWPAATMTWCYYHAQWEDWVEIGDKPTHWMCVEPPK